MFILTSTLFFFLSLSIPSPITPNIQRSPHRYAAELSKWRQRLVAQYEQEQRGPAWVQDGHLIQRVKGQLYSPNYPKQPPAHNMCDGHTVAIGAALELEPHQPEENPRYCQDFAYENLATANEHTGLLLKAVPLLCIAVSASSSRSTLVMDACQPPAATTYFHLVQNNTALYNYQLHNDKVAAGQTRPNYVYQRLEHVPSQQCIVALKGKGGDMKVSLATCDASADQWVFGASGRLCLENNLCLTVTSKK